jgi:hypothetical protein
MTVVHSPVMAILSGHPALLEDEFWPALDKLGRWQATRLFHFQAGVSLPSVTRP